MLMQLLFVYLLNFCPVFSMQSIFNSIYIVLPNLTDINLNHIGGVMMVSVLASSVVDHGFEPRSDQTKDFKISICWF